METVALADLENYAAGGLKYYYDAETGEEIEVREWVGQAETGWPSAPSAFTSPATTSAWCWALAALASCGEARGRAARPARAVVVGRSPHDHGLVPATAGRAEADAGRAWASPDRNLGAKMVAQLQADPKNFVYLDRKACADRSGGQEPSDRPAL